MSMLYLLTLAGVAVAMIALTWDAVRSVSRAPDWGRLPVRHAMPLDDDRRRQSLPFVGQERRQPMPESDAVGTAVDGGEIARRAA